MLACLAALHVACEASGLLMLILQLQLDFSDKKDLLALQFPHAAACAQACHTAPLKAPLSPPQHPSCHH